MEGANFIALEQVDGLSGHQRGGGGDPRGGIMERAGFAGTAEIGGDGAAAFVEFPITHQVGLGSGQGVVHAGLNLRRGAGCIPDAYFIQLSFEVLAYEIQGQVDGYWLIVGRRELRSNSR